MTIDSRATQCLGRRDAPRPRRTNGGASKCERPADVTPPPNGLTPAQYTFALEYVANGFNARRAYLKAHPRVTLATADVEGHRTLWHPKVRAFLGPKLEEGWKAQQMSGDEALARVSMIARADIRMLFDGHGKILDPCDWPEEVAQSVRSFKRTKDGYSLRMIDALAARRIILEHTGKLKTRGDTVDALAEALRGDLARHGYADQ